MMHVWTARKRPPQTLCLLHRTIWSSAQRQVQNICDFEIRWLATNDKQCRTRVGLGILSSSLNPTK